MTIREDNRLRGVSVQVLVALLIFSVSCASSVEPSQSPRPRAALVQSIDIPPAEGVANSADQPHSDIAVQVEPVIQNLNPPDPVGICTYHNSSVARDYGRTPLPTEAAILAGDADTMLAEWRNDAAQLSSMGTSALIVASSLGCTELMSLLIQHGAPVNEQLPVNTPLIAAVVSNNPAAVRLLLEHGADPDLESPYMGQTPLITAAGFDYSEILLMLLDAGADLYKADLGDQTALTFSAYGNAASAASILLRVGLALQPVDVRVAIQYESVDFVRAASEARAIAKLEFEERTRLAAAARDKAWVFDESAVSEIVRLLEEGS